MALERGGHLRVGLEDHTTGPTNLEQLERAKELVAKVGRRIIHGAEAINPTYSPGRYFDRRICENDGDFFRVVGRVDFPRTRPPFPHRARQRFGE
jgi:hypothetical protein